MELLPTEICQGVWKRAMHHELRGTYKFIRARYYRDVLNQLMHATYSLRSWFERLGTKVGEQFAIQRILRQPLSFWSLVLRGQDIPRVEPYRHYSEREARAEGLGAKWWRDDSLVNSGGAVDPEALQPYGTYLHTAVY